MGWCPLPSSSTSEPSLEPATLEILWQQDVGATVVVRGHDGSLSAGGLDVGIPAVSDLAELGHGATARRVGLSGAHRARERASGRDRARRNGTGDVRGDPARVALGDRGAAPSAAPARWAHVARLLGRDDRRVGAAGSRRRRRCSARDLRRCVRRRPRRPRSRPLRLRGRSDRPRPARCRRRPARQPADASAPERARGLSRRSHLGRIPSCRSTPASARSSADSRTGSIAASSDARAPRGS